MTIDNLNLLAMIAMALTCVISIALSSPSFHPRWPFGTQAATASLMETLRGRGSSRGAGDYSIRYITQGADGGSQFYRFTISRAGTKYRAYIDSMPRLNIPLDQSGVHCEGGRYYIDAGRHSSAADAEMAAKNWANAQSSTIRIGPT